MYLILNLLSARHPFITGLLSHFLSSCEEHFWCDLFSLLATCGANHATWTLGAIHWHQVLISATVMAMKCINCPLSILTLGLPSQLAFPEFPCPLGKLHNLSSSPYTTPAAVRSASLQNLHYTLPTAIAAALYRSPDFIKQVAAPSTKLLYSRIFEQRIWAFHH